jgi:predicted PurR-regulated permease PerM
VRAVVLATFLAAFAQGLATALALQVVGMGHFFIFLIAAAISALVPLAGTWMVWGPCAAWLAFQGHWTAAIGLALFGIVVVGLLDNVIRTYVLNSDAQLHPLLAFVSVLGALQVMGLWGIFFGPIIASCLYALVQIFLTELESFSATQPKPLAEPLTNATATMVHAAETAPAASVEA